LIGAGDYRTAIKRSFEIAVQPYLWEKIMPQEMDPAFVEYSTQVPRGNEPAEKKSVQDARVSTAIAWMRQQLSAGDIDVNNIAKAVNLSSSHFRHLFQQHTGTTPRRYHKLLRLQRAEHLLRGSFLNVKQVMIEVGWTDESHFCRDYKRVYGQSPSKVRSSAIKLDVVQLTMA
jgi:transcriptional regulator GlxA family with amidase domain